jgi:hypothetical protein
MGYHTIPSTEHTYGLIAYGNDGNERLESGTKFSQKLLEVASTEPITNVFFFSHGWKGDVPAAIEQYDSWIGALMASADLAKAEKAFPGFRPLLIGLHWPSLPWGHEDAGSDGSFAASNGPGPNQMLEDMVERLGDRPEIRGPLETIFEAARHDMSPDTLPDSVREAYLKLNDALGLGSRGVSAPPDADREGFDPEESYQAAMEDSANFGSADLSGIFAPLGQLSYWTMKKRARTVGEGGIHRFLNDLQNVTAARRARIHLMGHSFGTIVISGMLGGPKANGPLVRPVDSVALVQGAVSLWCYAPSIPFRNAGAGYFHRILPDGKISGPLVTTQSRYDKAVGQLYPLASHIHGSASFAVGAGFPEFGGIGSFGIQGLGGATQTDMAMLPATGSYGFERRKVYNLESSQYICKGGGASGAHSDIAGPEVAHAIWEAAFASV